MPRRDPKRLLLGEKELPTDAASLRQIAAMHMTKMRGPQTRWERSLSALILQVVKQYYRDLYDQELI